MDAGVPWNVAQVAYDITTEAALWRCSSELRGQLPSGWVLDSTISVDGVQRVLFRVDDVISVEDGRRVKELLDGLGLSPEST